MIIMNMTINMEVEDRVLKEHLLVSIHTWILLVSVINTITYRLQDLFESVYNFMMDVLLSQIRYQSYFEQVRGYFVFYIYI